MPIYLYKSDIVFTVIGSKRIKEFITHQLAKAGYKHITLSFVFCSDDYLLRINRDYLKHDYYTDIITFPLDVRKEHLEAEIYISIERVRENSLVFREKVSRSKDNGFSKMEAFESELLRVIFHGVLHLLGFKDKTSKQREEMRRMENIWLKKYRRAI